MLCGVVLGVVLGLGNLWVRPEVELVCGVRVELGEGAGSTVTVTSEGPRSAAAAEEPQQAVAALKRP
jgi:hypothetical protein